MDVYSWLFALIGKLLADSSVPAWLAETIVNALKNVLTAESSPRLSKKLRSFFARSLES